MASVEVSEIAKIRNLKKNEKITIPSIAGIDKNYQGEVVFAPNYTVGYLEQEPHLDDEKTVIEVVREGVAETVKLLDEFNHINDLFG